MDPLARDPLPLRGDRRETHWSEMPQTLRSGERGRSLAVKTNVELPGLVGGPKKIELSEGCTSGGAEARGLRCENLAMRGYEALGERRAL